MVNATFCSLQHTPTRMAATAAFELGRVRSGKAVVDRSLSAVFLLALVIVDRLRCVARMLTRWSQRFQHARSIDRRRFSPPELLGDDVPFQSRASQRQQLLVHFRRPRLFSHDVDPAVAIACSTSGANALK